MPVGVSRYPVCATWSRSVYRPAVAVADERMLSGRAQQIDDEIDGGAGRHGEDLKVPKDLRMQDLMNMVIH